MPLAGCGGAGYGLSVIISTIASSSAESSLATNRILRISVCTSGSFAPRAATRVVSRFVFGPKNMPPVAPEITQPTIANHTQKWSNPHSPFSTSQNPKPAVTSDAEILDYVRSTAAEGVRAAVHAGLGLCVTTEGMFQPDIAEGRIQLVLQDWVLPGIDLWAAFPTGRRASAKARAFAGFVETELRASGLLR